MSRLVPALLVHINLLLALYAGAGLATAARLKWDPSTYVLVRELFPREYRVATVALAAGAAALLVLVHLAAAPLCLASQRKARIIYILYAVCMAVLTVGEVSWAAWSGTCISQWLHMPQAQHLLELANLKEHIRPILSLLATYHPLPDKINQILKEAEEDAPWNLYVMCAMGALLLVLQPAGVVCALLAAARARDPASTPTTNPHAPRTLSSKRLEAEKKPLKTKYKNGKLMMV